MADLARQLDEPAAAPESEIRNPKSGGPPGPDWYSVPEAARVMGVTERHVRRRIASGELSPTARDGRGQYLVSPEAATALRVARGLLSGPAAPGSGDADLAGLSAVKRVTLARRQRIVEAYLAGRDGRPADMSVGDWAAAYLTALDARGERICRRTLHAWCRAYAAGGVAGLIDRRSYHGRASCSPAAWEYFSRLYLREGAQSIARIHELVESAARAEGWQWPCPRTVQRMAARDLDPALAAAGREPKRFRDRMLGSVRRDWSAVPAMGVWVADHRQFDLLWPRLEWRRRGKHTRLEWQAGVRPWLTAYLDGRTWYPTAGVIDFDSPTGDRTMEAFIEGVEAHGAPDAVTLDNGKDFRMLRFSGGRPKRPRRGESIVAERAIRPALELMGVAAHFALPYNARAKVIEPFFGLVARWFDRTWERCWCGHSPEYRPERLRAAIADRRGWAVAVIGERAVRAAESIPGDSPADQRRRDEVSLHLLRQSFAAWCYSDYALRESPAAACKPLSAARGFRQLRADDFAVRVPAAEMLALLCMPSVERCVTADGIYVAAFGRAYWHESLAGRVGGSGRDRRRKIVFRYRQDRPECIWVFDAPSDRFLCCATPAAGQGISPLATADDAEAAALAEAMAHQRRRSRDIRDEIKRLRQIAGNADLAAARTAAETLGKLDDLAGLPALDAPATLAFDSDLTAAAETGRATLAAAELHKQRRAAGRARARNTGTDDLPATEGPPQTRRRSLERWLQGDADEQPA